MILTKLSLASTYSIALSRVKLGSISSPYKKIFLIICKWVSLLTAKFNSGLLRLSLASINWVLKDYQAFQKITFCDLLNYKAKTNRIIIFPSWLVHWVPTNKSTKDRISISWNIQIKGQLGERHEYQSGQF